MTEIPEELLNMSDKELDKVLSDNIYKTRYLILDNVIRKKVAKVGKLTFLNDSRAGYRTETLAEYGFISLSKSKLESLKKDWIYKKWSEISKIESMNILYKKAVDVFGEEFTDLQDDRIIIYIPEITISNSVEQSHIIKDLYICLEIFNKRLIKFSIARTTATERELRNDYIFSHLGSGDIGSYQSNLCKGDTIIKEIYNKITSNSIDCIKNFTSFLYLLKEYFSWESLEGVPYRQINNVLNDSNRLKEVSIEDLEEDVDIEFLISLVKNNISDFSYAYTLEKGNYEVVLTEETRNLIDDTLTNKIENPSFLFKVYQGRSVIDSLNDSPNKFYNEYNNKLSDVYFKGEQKRIKIIPDNEDIGLALNLPVKIHREVLQQVISEFTYKFQQFLLNKKLNDE